MKGERSKTSSSGNLSNVLSAIGSGRQIYPPSSKSTLTFITPRKLGTQDAAFVEGVQTYLERRFQVATTVVGGGSGCSKVIVEVEAKDGNSPEEMAFNLLKQIARDKETREFLAEKDFTIAVSNRPYARLDTRTGNVEVFGRASGPLVDQSVEVHDVKDSQVSVRSRNVKQGSRWVEYTGEWPKGVKGELGKLGAVREQIGIILERIPDEGDAPQRKARVFSAFDSMIAAVEDFERRGDVVEHKLKKRLHDLKDACLKMQPNSEQALLPFNRAKVILDRIREIACGPKAKQKLTQTA